MYSPIPYLCCCFVLSLVTGSDCFNPVVYPVRYIDQCGQQAAILDDQLMEALQNIQQQISSVYLDCKDAYLKGQTKTGLYTIKPDNQTAFQVYCDMDTDGGGWTVFQHRMDGSVDFYRNWTDYEQGFGNLCGEYWLGLRKIHRLTPNASHELRVDLGDFEGNTSYARYGTFSVAGTSDNYRLLVSGYNGTAGDALTYHSGHQFTTYDRDNDASSGNCAAQFKGAWWYRNCYHANLNGLYHRGTNTSNSVGIIWYQWRGWNYSLKFTEIKLRKK